ncbi:uncharacterized protein FA14DRAFT_154854 [Meira miltonrushii]|uniref:Protein YOP1 n=1 Tax=Meira miltonrushii TaxID=1280837 RepID=A0A316VD74_9BASI|nr:uncharacterized protein FA14DRAFT_154854 [Meira miltonrushii]PWN35440.1 hypothetical protein FA14DRAFT_154854 [Meira miltonrushii]
MAAQLQQFQQKAEYFVSQIDKELSKYPQLNKLEQNIGIPQAKAYGAIGAFALFTLLVFFNIFAGFLTNLIGFFLPAYFSMKALDSPQPQDDVQWLTYWVVFGFFNFIETFVDVILHFVPMYYTFKTLAIVWLMLPQTQGAKIVYTRLVRPLLAQGTKATSAPAAGSAHVHAE